MKKRILLSLVSFFAMTAMWASLVDAYQIYPTVSANGVTGATAELTLNLKNKTAINTWSCTLVLPEGVTFKEAALLAARCPEGYNAEFTATPKGDGTVEITCTGEEGVGLTGTDGAVATVTVEIAKTVEPGEYTIVVKGGVFTRVDSGNPVNDPVERTCTWTIEKGEDPGVPGDLNGDGKVDIADAVTVLNVMATGEYVEAADLNGDQKIDIADFVTVLNIMAAQ